MKVLTLDKISKYIGKTDILKDISFYIEEGEIVGLVGPNGAGKSTTLKVVSGLLEPNSGTVTICGHNLKKERETALNCTSSMIEEPALYPYISGKEHLNFIGKLRSISKEDIEKTIDFIGISNRINDKVKTYSLGMKQRLALGLCLLPNPKLLILDEPTNGLDPTGISELRNTLKRICQNNGKSILVSSHNLSEIEKICNRVIFIQNGELVSVKDNINNNDICTYKLQVNKIESTENLLKNYTYIISHSFIDNTLTFSIYKNYLSDILQLFAANKIAFTDFSEVKENIEEDYKRIYKE